jgi:hypothetical protein
MKRATTLALFVSHVVASCGDSDGGGTTTVLDPAPDATNESSLQDGGRGDGDLDASDAADAPSDVATPDPDAQGPDADAGSPADAAEASMDAEAAADAVVSQFCGDSIRDPIAEECDDGTGGDEDSCTSDCRVQSQGVAPPSDDASAVLSRRLGTGRHVAAAGNDGFAVAYTEVGASAAVRMQPFDEWGRRIGDSLEVTAGAQPAGSANPVVAALHTGGFVVAWTDGSGGTPDVALRVVKPGTAPSGPPKYSHDARSGSQQDPDVLSVGSEIVVAWSDVFSVKWRTFSSGLSPLSGEQVLSGASAFAGNVALAPFGLEWAAAWRAGDQGLESVEVRVDSTTWSTPAFLPASVGDHPALLELDATHLLLVFTTGPGAFDAGAGTAERLRAAVIDVTVPGSIASTELVQLTSPYDTDASLRQSRPAATLVGDRIFVAWQTESPLGDPLDSELWVGEIGWSSTNPGVVELLREWPVPPDTPRIGDQANPGLAASPLFPGGALITVWEDESRTLSGRPSPDLLMNFRPTPLVMLGDGGG